MEDTVLAVDSTDSLRNVVRSSIVNEEVQMYREDIREKSERCNNKSIRVLLVTPGMLVGCWN